MSKEHTPGPWSYRGSLGPHSNPHLLGPHVVENATGIQIAILNGWRSEVSEANARLLAAAPDLLEALIVARQEAIGWYAESRGFDPETDKHPDWLVQSDAAITKATKE
jgi:hypothetical protein